MLARILSATILAVSAALIYFTCVFVTPTDVTYFHTLTEKGRELKHKNPLQGKSLTQRKQGVQKDIWLAQGDHVKAVSDATELTMSWQEGRMHTQEKMQPLYMELQGKMTCTADAGVYTYETQMLHATNNCCLLFKDESFATSDQIICDSSKNTCTLMGEKGVFFWQEGLTMRAPEVVVHKDRTVEGHGIVYCKVTSAFRG